LLAAAIAVAISFVSGQSALDQIRAENLSLQEQIEARTAAPNPDPAGAPSNAVTALSPQELNELLRLRGQIQPLRSQLAGLSNRLAQFSRPN
jgi:hypothetical protein